MSYIVLTRICGNYSSGPSEITARSHGIPLVVDVEGICSVALYCVQVVTACFHLNV